MATLTPRGLKIRIPLPISFTMLSYLQNQIKPFCILNDVENLETISDFLFFIALVYFTITEKKVVNFYYIVSLIFLIASFFKSVLYYIKPLRTIVKYYALIQGYGVYNIILFSLTYYYHGFKPLFMCIGLVYFLSFLYIILFLSPEKSFVYLINYHGNTNFNVNSLVEIKLSNNWQDVLTSFINESPELYSRYYPHILHDCQSSNNISTE